MTTSVLLSEEAATIVDKVATNVVGATGKQKLDYNVARWL